MHLARFPRARFAHLPTPLEPMPRLSAELGGPKLWVKRDDCTGLAGGGNKTRCGLTLDLGVPGLTGTCREKMGRRVEFSPFFAPSGAV